MGVRRRLQGLDSAIFKHLRRPDEPAESYLRRVAARRRMIQPDETYALQAALRDYFEELDRSAER